MSKRIRRSPAASRWSRWQNPTRRRRARCCAGSPASSNSITASVCSTRRSAKPSGCRSAISAAGSCRTRRSACSTRPAPASPSPKPIRRPASRKSRRAAAFAAETARLESEARLGRDHTTRLAELGDEAARLDEERHRIEARWRQGLETVRRIRALETELGRGPRTGDLGAELAGLRLELETQQGDTPLVPVSVDSRIVAEVVSGWTGIPVGRMLTDTLAAARSLRLRMAERIVGQDAALDTICRRIQTFYAELG